MRRFALALFLLPALASAQTTPVRLCDPSTGKCSKVINTAPTGSEYALVVRLLGGGSGGTASSFGAAFPATGTAAGAKVVSTPPTYTAGNMEGPTLDTAGLLRVNVVAGGAGGGNAQLQVFDGTAWDNVSQGAQSATVAHLPVAIQGSGVNIIEPLNTTPAGTEYALPVRTIGGGGDPSYTDATGTTVPANAAFVAGTDGTNTRALHTDTGGNLFVAGTHGVNATAGDAVAANVGLANASAPTLTEGRLNPVSLDLSGSLRATIVSSALPTGAATETTLGTRLAESTFTGRIPSGMTAPTSSPAGTEAGLVVRNIPSGTQAVSGTFWQATQPVSGTVTANAGTGNFTVVQATAANLNATVTGTVNAAQSGTWTVQPGNTANTTAWLTTSAGEIGNLSTASSGLSTATTLTQLVAASGSNRILVKSWKCSASVASTTTADQQCTLKYGTGTNCATGTTYLDGCFQGVNGGCLGGEIVVPASQALCWIHAAAGSKIVTVTYRQVP